MRNLLLSSIVGVLILVCVSGEAQGVIFPKTIRDIQESTAASNWDSAYNGQSVNVTDGIVTYAGLPPGKSSYRVVIQDPTQTEWAGVEIKRFGGTLNVQVGDKIELTNVVVDESYATTYLLFDVGSGFSVVSSGNSISPTVISPSLLGTGDTSANPAAAEKYEGMILRVENVTVGAKGFGSHADLYVLDDGAGSCWASDYMNQDRVIGQDYHANTVTGASFAAVEGIMEQYQKTINGYDHYQLLTRSTADFVPEPGCVLICFAGIAAVIRLGRK